MDMSNLDHLVSTYVIPLGIKILGAIALWVIGGFIIKAVQNVVNSILTKKKVDSTLVQYANSTLGIVLKIVLIIALLGVFGVETTSLSAILAAAGVAIGMAWSGLLSNFAAGIFLILFRPFKQGEMITAGGITGVVKEIGIFATAIDTAENVRVFVGNNKIFSDNIMNYNTNSFRRVDLKAQIAGSVDPMVAMEQLKEALKKVPGVLATPAPEAEIMEFNGSGTLLTVRGYAHNDKFWDVFFAGNKAILACGKANNWPAPMPSQVVVQK